MKDHLYIAASSVYIFWKNAEINCLLEGGYLFESQSSLKTAAFEVFEALSCRFCDQLNSNKATQCLK